MSLFYFPSCRTGIPSAVPQAASTSVTKLRSVYVTFLFSQLSPQVSFQLFLKLPVHQSQSWGIFLSLSFSQLSPQVSLQLFFKLPLPKSESHGKEMSSLYFFPAVNSSRFRLKLALFCQPYLPIKGAFYVITDVNLSAKAPLISGNDTATTLLAVTLDRFLPCWHLLYSYSAHCHCWLRGETYDCKTVIFKTLGYSCGRSASSWSWKYMWFFYISPIPLKKY